MGDAIREARVAIGLQVLQLAALSGASRRTMTRWEYGDSTPNVARRSRIVAAVASRSYDVAVRLAFELDVAAPPSPSPPPPETPPLPSIDVAAVARAALARATALSADALDVSPRRARAAIIIGLRELGAAGVGLDAFLAAFAEAAP